MFKKCSTILSIVFSICLLVGVSAFAEEANEEAAEASPYTQMDNPYIQMESTKINQAETKAYSYIYSGLSVVDQKRLWTDIQYLLEETDIRHITLFINSGGGSAYAGLALAGLIKRAQEEYDFTFEAEASGIIASAAVPVFAVCKIRKAQEGTFFMVHEAAIWKWQGRETSSDIKSQQTMMELLKEQYISMLVDNSNLSYDEWSVKEKETCWFTVKDARAWGLLERDGPKTKKTTGRE
jgi:ATP-dependent protease ClpP protease subunit